MELLAKPFSLGEVFLVIHKGFYSLLVAFTLVIAALTIANHFLLIQEDGSEFYLTDAGYFAALLLCAIMSFVVAKRYVGSEVFTKAYFFLGIGFTAWFIGELIFYYNILVLDVDPYPALSDPFYFAYYVFAAIHLALNTRYFKKRWNIKEKVWIIVLPILLTVGYLGYAYETWGTYDELWFDLSFDGVNVFGVSIAFTLAVFGAAIFRNSVLGTTWLLLAIGLVIIGFADIWYYVLEVSEAFTLFHPVNSVWPAGFMIIIYALYLHRKVL